MVQCQNLRYRFLFLPVVLGLLAGAAAGAGPDDLAQLNAVMAARLDAGVKYMLDGYHDQAIALFSQLEQEFPESPAGSLRKAEALWWKIFKTEADFNRLHEMDVLKSKQPPFEAEFHAAADRALRLSETLVKRYKGNAYAFFFLGAANGLKSQMEGGKDNVMASAKFAKKMKQNLDKCLSIDPGFTEAYLEVGLYNYYIGSLPAVLNMFKFTLGLPAGDKRKGIDLVKTVKDKGGLLAAEAKFYLASIYAGPDQKKYREAIDLVSELHKDYPNNPTFHLLLGHLYEKGGQPAQAQRVYNEVVRLGERRHENYDEAIIRQARAGLKRATGGED